MEDLMAYPIFPFLTKQPSARVNLNETFGSIAKKDIDEGLKNRLLDPYIFDAVIAKWHESRSLTWSFGGYLETRLPLWSGTYIDLQGKSIHPALDFYVPQGTPVCVSRDCVVERIIENDHPEKYGWGYRIVEKILGLEKPIRLILAHCVPEAGLKVGDQLAPGTQIATVAPPELNGGWFAHAHVQAVNEEGFAHYFLENNLSELDGYYLPGDPKLAWFPDPLEWIDL